MKALAADDPEMIGGYRLRTRLGEGGMGRVYLGVSPAGRAVAVKVLHPELARDGEFLQRFRREIAAARAVSGIYTAPVVATGLDDQPPWLATELVAGPSLEQAVREHGPMPEPALYRLFAGLVEALAAIHRAGVVHRDLKPSNVLLSADGPRVIDFGISRATEGTSMTATGMVFGSPAYMSPEQAEGRPTEPPSDVFSLGCLIAFAATAAPPFGAGNAASVLYRVVHSTPELGKLPPRIGELVARCLDKDPAARPDLGTLAVELAAQDGAAPITRVTAFWPAPVAALINAYQNAMDDERASTMPTRKPVVPAPTRKASYPPPRTIAAAARLMYACVAYAFVFAIASWLVAVTHSSDGLTIWQGHWRIRTLGGLAALGFGYLAAQVTLWLTLARASRDGRRRARPAVTLLFAVYTAAVCYAAVMHTFDRIDTLATIGFGLTWLFAAPATYLLWRHESSRWLRQRAD